MGCRISCKPGKSRLDGGEGDHWGFSPGDSEETYLPVDGKEGKYEYAGEDHTERYRKLLRTAETCLDYEDLRNEKE